MSFTIATETPLSDDVLFSPNGLLQNRINSRTQALPPRPVPQVLVSTVDEEVAERCYRGLIRHSETCAVMSRENNDSKNFAWQARFIGCFS